MTLKSQAIFHEEFRKPIITKPVNNKQLINQINLKRAEWLVKNIFKGIVIK